MTALSGAQFPHAFELVGREDAGLVLVAEVIGEEEWSPLT
jgi:hypothetical protein